MNSTGEPPLPRRCRRDLRPVDLGNAGLVAQLARGSSTLRVGNPFDQAETISRNYRALSTRLQGAERDGRTILPQLRDGQVHLPAVVAKLLRARVSSVGARAGALQDCRSRRWPRRRSGHQASLKQTTEDVSCARSGSDRTSGSGRTQRWSWSLGIVGALLVNLDPGPTMLLLCSQAASTGQGSPGLPPRKRPTARRRRGPSYLAGYSLPRRPPRPRRCTQQRQLGRTRAAAVSNRQQSSSCRVISPALVCKNYSTDFLATKWHVCVHFVSWGDTTETAQMRVASRAENEVNLEGLTQHASVRGARRMGCLLPMRENSRRWDSPGKCTYEQKGGHHAADETSSRRCAGEQHLGRRARRGDQALRCAAIWRRGERWNGCGAQPRRYRPLAAGKPACRLRALAHHPPYWPATGGFATILVDPPWPAQGGEKHYRTVSLTRIKATPVGQRRPAMPTCGCGQPTRRRRMGNDRGLGLYGAQPTDLGEFRLGLGGLAAQRHRAAVHPREAPLGSRSPATGSNAPVTEHSLCKAG